MSDSAVIEIPRHLMQSARATPDELKIELAVHLYEQRRLSIGHARELAGLSLWEFRQLLLSRRISPHYDVADLDEDMQTWAKLDIGNYSAGFASPCRPGTDGRTGWTSGSTTWV